jgi:integrase
MSGSGKAIEGGGKVGKRGNGEGSITKRKDGRYVARYVVYTAKGPKRKNIYAKTRKEAAEKLSTVQADLNKGVVYDDENLTLGEYLDSWLKGSVLGTVRQSTYDRYEIAVRVHLKPALGRIKLSKLTAAKVSTFYQEKRNEGCADSSINKLHVTLHKALDQAAKWQMIPRNVCEVVDSPRPSSDEIRPLSTEETKRLLEAAKGDELEAVYILAVHTGMRQGEILALKWTDVDLENFTISVRRTLTKSGTKIVTGETKTSKGRRTITLTTEAVSSLREHLDRQLEDMERLGDLYRDNGFVFTTYGGTFINPSNLRRRSFKKLLERAGLPQIRFHDLRHTCATILFKEGKHPKLVQELLGHANVAITLDTYSHVIPGMGEQTARAMEDALR